MWRPEDPHRSQQVQTSEHCILTPNMSWNFEVSGGGATYQLRSRHLAASHILMFVVGSMCFKQFFILFCVFGIVSWIMAIVKHMEAAFNSMTIFCWCNETIKIHRLDAACYERFGDEIPVPQRSWSNGQRRVHEDYKYLLSAMQSHPERLLGVFVADPTVTDPETWMEDITKSHKNWVPWSGERNDGINILHGKGWLSIIIQFVFAMLVLLCGVIWVLFNMYRKQMPPLRCLFESVFGMIQQHPWLQLLNEWMSLSHLHDVEKDGKKGGAKLQTANPWGL